MIADACDVFVSQTIVTVDSWSPEEWNVVLDGSHAEVPYHSSFIALSYSKIVIHPPKSSDEAIESFPRFDRMRIFFNPVKSQRVYSGKPGIGGCLQLKERMEDLVRKVEISFVIRKLIHSNHNTQKFSLRHS